MLGKASIAFVYEGKRGLGVFVCLCVSVCHFVSLSLFLCVSLCLSRKALAVAEGNVGAPDSSVKVEGLGSLFRMGDWG